MPFDAKVLADSQSPAGHRLTTLEATFPRFVLAEFNTHRVFSRNSASSRAIPIAKQLRRVLEDPYVPIEFGSNQPGMQAGAALTGEKREAAEREWLGARDDAVRRVLGLVADPDAISDDDLLESLGQVEEAIRNRAQPAEWLNVHKQVANRLLEPFMWHTVIVTATEWDNFWNLRCHPDAQPEIRLVAESMRAAALDSQPAKLDWDEWHLPLIRPEDREQAASIEDLVKISAGRCARVSYLTHAGKRDLEADIQLHDRLLESGHMSPLEHPAKPLAVDELEAGEWSGNFKGWRSYRKSISGEANPLGPTTPARAVAEQPAAEPAAV
jgi:thymidylate synthase ThyX